MIEWGRKSRRIEMSDRASLQRLLGDLDADCPLQNEVIKKQIVSLFDSVMDEQFVEIARLQAELDADDLMAREAELFKPEYIRQLETDNVRLQAQVATLESIMEREAEKTMKAGMPGELR
jgi:tetrahydrodipicolinate N-succinyltransferase